MICICTDCPISIAALFHLTQLIVPTTPYLGRGQHYPTFRYVHTCRVFPAHISSTCSSVSLQSHLKGFSRNFSISCLIMRCVTAHFGHRVNKRWDLSNRFFSSKQSLVLSRCLIHSFIILWNVNVILPSHQKCQILMNASTPDNDSYPTHLD